jgi:hypothetical protein
VRYHSGPRPTTSQGGMVSTQQSTSPVPSITTDLPVFVSTEVPVTVGGVFVPANQFGKHQAFIAVAGELDATEQARVIAELVEGTVYALAG